MGNKRRYYRVKIKLPLTFRLPLLKREFEGSTLNISGTGLAFSTKQAVNIGQKLIMKLSLPGDEVITVQGQVVWAERFEGSGPSSQWSKAGIKLDEDMRYDGKKYLKFYSQELSRLPQEDIQ